jgi:hypothetical protein
MSPGPKIVDGIPSLSRALDEVPGSIGMHRISEPTVVSCAEREGSFDKGGILVSS